MMMLLPQYRFGLCTAALALSALLGQHAGHISGAYVERAAPVRVADHAILCENLYSLYAHHEKFGGLLCRHRERGTMRYRETLSGPLSGDGLPLLGGNFGAGRRANGGIGPVAPARFLPPADELVRANADGGAAFTKAAEVRLVPFVWGKRPPDGKASVFFLGKGHRFQYITMGVDYIGNTSYYGWEGINK